MHIRQIDLPFTFQYKKIAHRILVLTLVDHSLVQVLRFKLRYVLQLVSRDGLLIR